MTIEFQNLTCKIPVCLGCALFMSGTILLRSRRRKTCENPHVNSLLTVQGWWFWCGSLLSVLVSEFRWCFTLCLFIILLVRFVLLSGQLLENSCPFRQSFVLIVFCLIVILEILRVEFNFLFLHFMSIAFLLVDHYYCAYSRIALKALGRDCTNNNELFHKIGVL